MNNTSGASSVPSAKNVWIMCPSKSHPGLKFYINKETGIKVWNITESEIAIAEKAGRSDPEPPGWPTMDNSRDAKIYNKQIINNQFSNQLSNMLVNSVPVCPFNVWDNPQNLPPHMQHQLPQIHHQPPQMQHQLHSIVSAAIAPFVDRIEAASKNFSPQPTLQHTSAPYFPNQYAQIRATPQKLSKTWYRKNKWNKKYQNHTSDANNFSRPNDCDSDLRKKLVRKRKFSESFVQNDQDGDKSNRIESELEETSTQVNLKPLKTLTQNSNTDRWYIVVEKDVILENFNYLNNMAAADPDCHILVPHHVMSELRTYVSESNDVQARRILRFLTQQIESGLAMLGEEVDVEGICHKTILTCIKLASLDNNVVVLISSNEETLKYRPLNKDIHVFTMQNIKDILANTAVKVPRPISPTMSIKIVVPNNINNENISRDNTHETISQINIRSNELPDPSHLSKNAMKEPLRVSSVTDSNEEPVVTKTGMLKSNTEKRVTHENRLPETVTRKSGASTKHAITGVSTTSVMGMPPMSNYRSERIYSNSAANSVKAKVIAPIRNEWTTRSVDYPKSSNKNMHESSVDSAESFVSLDTVRMKRIISMKNLKSKLNSKASKEPAKTIVLNRNINKELTPQKTKSPSTSASCDNYNTSEAVKRNVSENVIVEETSTSGIISNTDSSYSENVVSPVRSEGNKYIITLRTPHMFSIGGQSMEEVLKTRSDEWVLRFVQIMEEVLRVKLQEKTPFENKEPAPWNLKEAANCILLKFNKHFNVVEAANKLTFILFKVSDKHGKINENILPSDFMEMYSYGVFLIETLMELSAECTDKDCRQKNSKIQNKYEERDCCSCYEVMSASESLKELLYDIQNANLQTFADNEPSDLATDNQNNFDYTVDDEVREPQVTESQHDEMQCNDNAINYPNLRSQKRKSVLAVDEVPQKVTINDKDPKSVFFDSLQLEKSCPTNKDVLLDAKDLKNAEKQNALKNNVLCSIKSVHASEQVHSDSSQNELEDRISRKCNISKDDDRNIAKSPSKVIRNFTINADLERKVKARRIEKENEDYAEETEAADGNENVTDMPKTMAKNRSKASEDKDIVKSPTKAIRTCKINTALKRKVKARRSEKAYNEHAEDTEKVDGLNDNLTDMPKTMEPNSSKSSDDKEDTKSPTKVIQNFTINADLERKVQARRSEKACNEHPKEIEKADGLNENLTDMPKTMEKNSSKASDDKDVAKSPTKFIRNFTINSDLERKLKARRSEKSCNEHAEEIEKGDGLNENLTDMPKTMETNSSKASDDKDVPKSPTEVIRNFTINADLERKVKARRIEKECEHYAEETEEPDGLNEKFTDVPKTIETNSSKESGDKDDAKSPTKVIRKCKINAALKRKVKAIRHEKEIEEYAEETDKADGLNEEVTDTPKTRKTNGSKVSDDKNVAKSPTKIILNRKINAALKTKVKAGRSEEAYDEHAKETEKAYGVNEKVTDVPKAMETNGSKASDDKDITKSPSKVIRNFTINADFERKVKARCYENQYEDYAEETEEPEVLRETVTDNVPKTMETNGSKAPDDKDVAKSPTEVISKCIKNAGLRRKVKARRYEKEYNEYAEETEEADRLSKKVADVPKTMKANGSKAIQKKDFNMPNETQYSDHVPVNETLYSLSPTTKQTVDDTPKANEAVDSLTFNEFSVNNGINNEANKKFMCFIGRLVRRLGDVFTQVKLLCDTYVKEVKNNQCDVSTRELRQKVEKACMLIGNIHKSLESIAKRELDKDKSIQMLLTIAKVDDFIPDDKLCLEYRHVINNCKERVEVFQNIVRRILKIAEG